MIDSMKYMILEIFDSMKHIVWGVIGFDSDRVSNAEDIAAFGVREG
jgi:hypothetical protein